MAIELTVSLYDFVCQNILAPFRSLNISDKDSHSIVGELILIESSDTVKDPLTPAVRKRAINNLVPEPRAKAVRKVSTVRGGFNALEKDLKTLNLIPTIADGDFSCKMCPYVASRKDHLRTHYQLKHFGGGDLLMQCQICSVKLKTKSYMKKHYISKHKLTDVAAANMAESSGLF